MALQRRYSIKDIAKALSVSYDTVQRRIKDGSIPQQYVQKMRSPGGSIMVRIHEAAIDFDSTL